MPKCATNAVKPIESAAVDYYSHAPDKVKARTAINDAYAKALDSGTPLITKLQQVKDSFNRAVLDMAR